MKFLMILSLLSVIMISLISNTENYNQLFAQPTHATKVNTTDIDRAIVDMLNKISRGNVIDSTLNSIVSGMNVGTTQTNLSLPSSSNEANSIISTDSINTNSKLATSQSGFSDLNKFVLKIINQDNNTETIVASNSLIDFNNKLIKFCTTLSLSSFECISNLKDSIQSVEFTNSYMGPTKLITYVDNYKLDLEIK
ncbi:MAG TPA: hypothetical protein VJ767_02270 [Nitrososphaeraceae archaeon]|nr:hypothetical protein [Nitrososphaeraceae archaeon]